VEHLNHIRCSSATSIKPAAQGLPWRLCSATMCAFWPCVCETTSKLCLVIYLFIVFGWAYSFLFIPLQWECSLLVWLIMIW